jgi:hypothetical protein
MFWISDIFWNILAERKKIEVSRRISDGVNSLLTASWQITRDIGVLRFNSG